MVIANVKPLSGSGHDCDELRIAVAQVVRAAVEVDVDQSTAVHVVEEITFASVDDQIDAHILPRLGFTRVPELL